MVGKNCLVALVFICLVAGNFLLFYLLGKICLVGRGAYLANLMKFFEFLCTRQKLPTCLFGEVHEIF
jgi:hypothetical protein